MGLAKCGLRGLPSINLEQNSRLKLKMIDCRYNLPNQSRPSPPFSSKYLETVTIFAWGKRNEKNTYNETVDEEDSKFDMRKNAEYITLTPNPLHIFHPTDEQVKFMAKYFTE